MHRAKSAALVAVFASVGCLAFLASSMYANSQNAPLNWCGGSLEDVHCAAFAKEAQRRPWSYKRIWRMCLALGDETSSCSVFWTIYHAQMDGLYQVVSAVLVLTSGLLLAILVLPKAGFALCVERPPQEKQLPEPQMDSV